MPRTGVSGQVIASSRREERVKKQDKLDRRMLETKS